MNDQRDYTRRANANRPTDPGAIAAEVIRLHGTGLMARDIAQCLQLNVAEVRQILTRYLVNSIGGISK